MLENNIIFVCYLWDIGTVHTKIYLSWIYLRSISCSSSWESVHTHLDRSWIDLSSLWESVHTHLDRSQFAFERSHSGRFGLRSIWDRSNSLVWMAPYSIGTWTSWSLGKLENSFQETLVLRALVNPKLALVVSLWKHGNVFFFNHYFLNNNVRSARNLSIQNNSLQCFCITYNLSQLSVEEGQSYNL